MGYEVKRPRYEVPGVACCNLDAEIRGTSLPEEIVVIGCTDLKLKRRPFQFSLRKLLLWTTVWSVYLGTLRSLGIWPPIAIIVTIYLASLFAIRIIWGYEEGLRLWFVIEFAVPITSFGATLLTTMVHASDNVVPVLFFTPYICMLGVFFGIYGFMFVHFVMCAVDWLDKVMQTKPPQDQ